MPKTENKIDANDRSVLEVLDKKKYTVDYFQREYSWKDKHIQQLVTDLTDAFLACYDPKHQRAEVADYNTYYLGPFVLSEKDGVRSIIDGQQRLTSLTLFLIYLLGEITGEYRYGPGTVKDHPHVRSVAWKDRASRDLLSVESRNSLGSTLTLFASPGTSQWVGLCFLRYADAAKGLTGRANADARTE